VSKKKGDEGNEIAGINPNGAFSRAGGGNAVQGVPRLACNANGTLTECDGGNCGLDQSVVLALFGNHTICMV